MSKIVDAIKELGDNPPKQDVIAIALVSIAHNLERIANTLEKCPSAVTNVYAPNLREADRAATSWIKWNGQDRGPWKNLDPRSTVRVQFRSKPDHIETYRLDSSEIDWSDVMAYQIVNRSE